MVDIYIVDDNFEFLNYIKTVIEKSIFINNYDARLFFTACKPTDIYKNIKTNPSIFILDIEFGLKEINGIKLGKWIRESNTNSYIIYLTGYSQYLLDTIDNFTRPSAYILKTDFEDIALKINNSLEKIFKEFERNIVSNTLAIKTVDKNYILNLSDILYFITSESNSNKINVYTNNSFFTFKSTKKGLMYKLDENFIRINSSTVVNIKYINYIDKKEKTVNLINSTKFYYSRNYLKRINNILKE